MQMIALSIQLRNRETVINTMETLSQVLFNWFSDNFMETNRGKSHILMSGTKTTHANFDSSMIKSSQKEMLFGINVPSELKFEDHVNFMCKEAKTLCSYPHYTIHGIKTEEKHYESLC